ncbi:MAG: RagB/SusD family nutrient uptake outer membrane protein [Porphyromonadaceae bacterium]|nr:RagB/SusD family nutrient uptake outer membrane protein [Porphyromonadaceae bacterium]
MKKIISTFLCAGLLASFTACSSFLDENPKSSLASNQFFTTASQAESNVNYLYRTGAPSMYGAGGAYGGPNVMLGGYVSGYFDNEYAGQEVVVMYSKSLSRNSVNIANQMDGVWDACYEAINVANAGIKYIPEITMDETAKARLVGESKFFRAMNYFYLVKMFGDVPLTVDPYESLENLYLERTPVKDVYAQIVQDAKDAVAVLPDAAFYSNGARLTKNVANTLLADVYLQMSGYPVQEDHYADAAAAAKAVITSGKHSLATNGDLKMNSAFNKLRTTDGLDESVYAYEFNAAISNSGWWPVYSFPNACAGWGIFKYAITNNVYGIVHGYTNVYDSNEDLRIQPNQFFHSEYKMPDGTVRQLGGLFNWYYYDEEAMLTTGRGTKDVNIYRYAQVLLIAAEATAKSGSVSEAAGYLAEVKARSSMTGKTKAAFTTELSSLSKDAFVQEVWAERLREFPLEFKIWDDITRTHMYPQFSDANKGKVSFVNVIGASNNWGKTFQERDLLWPLSTNELQRNTLLTQNPGYEN